MLIAYLRDRDAACPLCGYNLRGLTSSRCPECGRRVRLTIGMVQPYLMAWVTSVVPSCANAGSGLIIATVFALAFLRGERGLGGNEAWIAYSYMAMVPIAITIIIARPWLLRRSKRVQWALAGVLFCSSAILFLALLRVIVR